MGETCLSAKWTVWVEETLGLRMESRKEAVGKVEGDSILSRNGGREWLLMRETNVFHCFCRKKGLFLWQKVECYLLITAVFSMDR